ncbi:hypothetical protein [Botrimarina sp.]|uniref:hypothetical protein n=1 Tax=Botrimarina sp. TaxID=2795802 RepID=UPI0032ECA0DE
MQYTIRNITEEIDRAARERAEREGATLNDVLLRALRAGFGVESNPTIKRTLPASFGKTPLEPKVLEALDDQRKVDPRDWE